MEPAASKDDRNIELTLAEWVRIFYGYKSLAFDILMNGDAASGTHPTLIDGVSVPANEQEVVFYTAVNVSGSNPPVFYQFALDYTPWYDSVADTYWIRFSCTITNGASEATTTDTGNVSAMTCSVYGENITLYDGGAPNAATGNFDITLDEFWEHRKADNSAPIFTTAGAQLLDPHQTDELPSAT